MSAKLVIVTAADERFRRCLYQFLRDIERRQIHRGQRILAYDLGLAPATLAWLRRRFSWCEFRRFPFEAHPPHVAVKESFAWKPLILAELMCEEPGLLLWLDSASLFHTRDLAPVWERLAADGVYTLRGQSSIAERCDPQVLDALAVPAQTRRQRERVAGAAGFDARMPDVRALLAEWARLAGIADYIMPRRTAMFQHKSDQSLLNILLHRFAGRGAIRLGEEDIDISAARPVAWMSSRNIVGPDVPRWADPFVRLYYRVYKLADQASWRWRNWRDTRLHGFLRRLKEHFSVLLRDEGGRVWRLPAPDWCYYADPFLVRHRGQIALLVERFDYRICRGDLCAITLDGNLRPGPAVSIIPRDRHMSFPFVFAHEDELYLVPETGSDRMVEIFRCTRFPDSWEPVAIALNGVDAVDTVIFPHDGLWWLVTSIRPPEGGRYLAIWHAGDFRTGPWRAHPVNERRLYHALPQSSGRNGGAIIRHEGMLLRPAQSSSRFYGEGMQLMRIDCLTPTEYRESVFEGDHPTVRIVTDFSPHHLSLAGGLAAFDIRDRARGWEGLRPFPLPRRPAVGLILP